MKLPETLPAIFADRIYSRSQAAQYLNRDPRTLLRWEEEGVGPSTIRQPGSCRSEYIGADLLRYIYGENWRDVRGDLTAETAETAEA